VQNGIEIRLLDHKNVTSIKDIKLSF